jgi:Protein of unknown function (DUF3467)
MAETDLPQDPPEQEQLDAKMGQVSDAPILYVNTTRIASSFFDIQMHFGESIQTSSLEELTRARVIVVMTPEHARAFADLLTKTLDDYEVQFGKLRRLPT